jgi:hypothetical protein
LLQQPEGPSKSQGDEDEEAALDAEVIAISSSEELEAEEASPEGSSPEEPQAQDPAETKPAAEEPAAPTEDQQQNVGVAPAENPPDFPDGLQSGDPEITDVEFTPLESAHLDEAQLESAAVAIEPEEAAEEAEGTDLDPQIR